MTLFELEIFGLTIAPTWYGLMYALGFIISYEYIKRRGILRTSDGESFFLMMFLGVIIGGRIGYILFYDLSYYLAHPIEIFSVWKGGMSFHGGALGVILALIFFSWKKKYPIYDISDMLVTILPVALGLGRIGNLINRELLGYTGYTGPFAIIQGGVSYFPSPLLQAFLEGGVLFIILLSWRGYEKKHGSMPGVSSAIFLIGYGVFRIIAELFRTPDVHIGYILGTDWITLGMIYSLPMILGGVYILMRREKNLRKN